VEAKGVGAQDVYDATDPAENDRRTRDVAALLRKAGMDPYDANSLALLGGLPGTDGPALEQPAQGARHGQPGSFDSYRQLALPGGGQRIAGASLTVEEGYARLAALGYEGSPLPVAFHCVEEGCHARAQLMIDQLRQLGLSPGQVRRAWAFSERAFGRAGPRMRPTTEGGSPLLDYQGAVIEFDYHVAPGVLVEGPGGAPGLRVLDPSLLGHPAEVDLWHQRAGTPLQFPLSAQVTALGVPPIHPGTGRPFPGSGYRPWADPQPRTPAHDAETVMVDIMVADAMLGRPARPLPLL
jgi:hypothetical protein